MKTKNLAEYTAEELKKELERRANSLEEEFKQTAALAQFEIKKQLNIIEKAMQEAIKISETYGVPFRSNYSPLSPRTYIPHSFEVKWKTLNSDAVEDICDATCGEAGWEYWNSSSLYC